MNTTLIRKAVPGEEPAIHEAHMKSIREICVKLHGEDEIKGWGYRPLGNRWTAAIASNQVWVVEQLDTICGFGYTRCYDQDGEKKAELVGLYLTPEVSGQGFGEKLVKLMLDEVRAQGVSVVTLHSSITAHNFYQRMGFTDSRPSTKMDIGGYPVTTFPMQMIL